MFDAGDDFLVDDRAVGFFTLCSFLAEMIIVGLPGS